jgi:hypothetical protein
MSDIIKFPGSAVPAQTQVRLASVGRAARKCKRDLDTIFNHHSDDDHVLSRQEMYELTLPQLGEVLLAAQLLDMIMNGGEVVTPEFVVAQLKILQTTISTQKKSEQEIAATMMSGVSIFDFDLDSAGADLDIWDTIPRHPDVVNFAVQSLIRMATFSPSLAELATACRSVHYRLEKAFGAVLDWLDRFNRLDASRALETRESLDEWARSLTLETIATIEAIDEQLSHFKRSVNWYVFDTTRLQDAKPKQYPLRDKFLAAIKNKLTVGEEPTLSDAEIEVIAIECGWESWSVREAREREQHERFLEEERRKKEQERLWKRRRHHCAFCGKSDKAVERLQGISLVEKPKLDASSLLARLAVGVSPFQDERLGPKPVAICNVCLESDPHEQAKLVCSFCDAEKPAVLNNAGDAICLDCFQEYVEEFRKWDYPLIDFIIGKKGKFSEASAKYKAKEFNEFVKLHEGKAAIYLKMEGYEDDYGQPLYSDEAPKVAAYVRSWARFAKLDLKRAVQLFGPDTWGGNDFPETLYFLLMCDALGEFKARFDADDLTIDECVEAAVKLCATRKGN